MIKKRNLDPSLIQWIMTVTGLGPGVGEIFYVAPASSSTSQYRTHWQEMGVEKDHKIYTLPSLAYADMTAERNDVMLVAPGKYTETATIDWTKDHAHAIGLGGPNLHQRYGRPNVLLFCDTAAVDYTVHLTGDFCQFHNFMVGNGHSTGSATADNLSALGIAGYGNYFSRMGFQGVGSATQAAAAACSSVEIMAGAGELTFENCLIGGNTYVTTRSSTTSGQLLLTSTVAGVANGIFKDCLFLSRSAVAATAMVHRKSQAAYDRAWVFDRCHFDNFNPNWAADLTNVFDGEDQSPQTSNITLKDCTAFGYTYWMNTNTGAGADKQIRTNSPAVAALGGICLDASGVS